MDYYCARCGNIITGTAYHVCPVQTINYTPFEYQVPVRDFAGEIAELKDEIKKLREAIERKAII